VKTAAIGPFNALLLPESYCFLSTVALSYLQRGQSVRQLFVLGFQLFQPAEGSSAERNT